MLSWSKEIRHGHIIPLLQCAAPPLLLIEPFRFKRHSALCASWLLAFLALVVITFVCSVSGENASLSDGNSPPDIETIYGVEVEANGTFEYQVNASDPDNDSITYDVTSDLPLVSINATGWLVANTTIENAGNRWINISADDGNGSLSWENFTLLVDGPPEARFVINDIAGTKEKLESVGESAESYPIYEVFWGDTVKFQSEAIDPGHEARRDDGIVSESWDFDYNGSQDNYFNSVDNSSIKVTVGQDGHFIYDRDSYLKKNGKPLLYGPGWDDGLSPEYRYLREILGAGKINDGSMIYLPPPAVQSLSTFYDYPMRFMVNDTGGDTDENIVILRVLPVAQPPLAPAVEDVYGNPMTAKATLTWRGRHDDAAADKKSITNDTPVFVFINATSHPQGLPERGELGIYYNVDVVGTLTQDTGFGFCFLVVNLPYNIHSLENVGIVSVLEERVKICQWEVENCRFVPLETSLKRVEDFGFELLAVATVAVDDVVEQGMVLVPLVYTVHERIDRAELKVEDITFNRNPAKPGCPVSITAHLRNTGVVHSGDSYWRYRSVLVRFSVNSVQFCVDDIYLPAGTPEPFTLTAMYNVTPDIHGRGSLKVSVLIDPHNYCPEWNETDNLASCNLLVVRTNILWGTPGGHMLFEGDSNSWYTVRIVKSSSSSLGVGSAEYFLVSNESTTIEFGKVSDIYGYNPNDPSVNVSFQDNDLNGRVTTGDTFMLKGVNNGGNCGDGYTLTIKYSETDEVSMKQNTFNKYDEHKPKTDAQIQQSDLEKSLYSNLCLIALIAFPIIVLYALYRDAKIKN